MFLRNYGRHSIKETINLTCRNPFICNSNSISSNSFIFNENESIPGI
jgi:hypothetical protein